MRAVFGVLSLLVVAAIVGVLVKKQLGGGSAAEQSDPAATPSAVVRPTGTPQQQVQQVQKAVEAGMQQARPMPDDK